MATGSAPQPLLLAPRFSHLERPGPQSCSRRARRLPRMNWPVETAVLLGFILSLSSTAVAIAVESEMPQDALLLSFRSAIQKKPPLAGRRESDREEV